MSSTLGKYTLHEELGRGGFATVYRATHATLQTEAAVKVLSPALAQDDKARQRFMREAQAASALDHPHIVRILDMDEDQGQVFIAMEYLPGGDLKCWIKEHGPLARPDLLRILGQVAAALDYAHGKGMLHRDVKPGNILLDASGGAHLSDFGLVRPADAPHLTQLGSVVGTATYCAPEQAEARPDIDGRADQYALAVVAYELIVGQPPFSGESSTAVSLMHVTKPPPPPSSQRPEVPAEIDETLLKALAKQPGQRYASCNEFVRALEAAYKDSDVRRFKEMVAEARQALEGGDYAALRQRLDAARTLLPDDASQRDLLLELDQTRQQAETYQQIGKDWHSAVQKGQAVLEAFPDYPDPQGLFLALELRKLRRLPPRLEKALQIAAGSLLGLGGLALALYLAFIWITRKGG